MKLNTAEKYSTEGGVQRIGRAALMRVLAALVAAFMLALTLPINAVNAAAQYDGEKAVAFGDGLRASGGHNINAFICWALKHVDPETVPQGATLALPANECGTEPWQYLYGTIRLKTTDAALNSFYLNHYSKQHTDVQYAELTAHWNRSGYATDCQGLLDAWFTYEQGESTDLNVQMNWQYWCTQKGAIDEIDRPFRIGEAVFKKANSSDRMVHIGWICGFDEAGRALAVEARGISYGVVITTVEHREWTHRGLMTAVFNYPALGSGDGGLEEAAPELPENIDEYIRSEAEAEAAAFDGASERVFESEQQTGFAGGTGVRTDPYLISTAAQLRQLASRVNSGNPCTGEHYLITNNIYLNDTSNWESWDEDNAPQNEWIPIGYWDSHSNKRPFSGSIDGGGHSIHGLYYSDDEDSMAGLFGYVVGASSVIKNISVERSFICALNSVGGIVGYAAGDVRIQNCSFSGTLDAELWVGAVCGYTEARSQSPIIERCRADGHIDAFYAVGGIVGAASQGTRIAQCFNKGFVDSCDFSGGVAGSCRGAAVMDCYNCGRVYGTQAMGGVAGRIINSSIINCYNTGELEINEHGGGAIGLALNGGNLIQNCYYLENLAEPNGLGTARTQRQMMCVDGYAGFDFENVWRIVPYVSYPFAQLRSNQQLALPDSVAGDANGDGLVTVADAISVMRCATGLSALESITAENCDMDNDGSISISDAVLILRAAMGM